MAPGSLAMRFLIIVVDAVDKNQKIEQGLWMSEELNQLKGESICFISSSLLLSLYYFILNSSLCSCFTLEI